MSGWCSGGRRVEQGMWDSVHTGPTLVDHSTEHLQLNQIAPNLRLNFGLFLRPLAFSASACVRRGFETGPDL